MTSEVKKYIKHIGRPCITRHRKQFLIGRKLKFDVTLTSSMYIAMRVSAAGNHSHLDAVRGYKYYQTASYNHDTQAA